MGVVAAAEVRQTSTRHYLFVVAEGAAGLPDLRPDSHVTIAVGALALDSAGSDMGVLVSVERHDAPPAAAQASWECVVDMTWQLPSGRLGVGNVEGLLEWIPDLGLRAGSWHARVLVTGRDEAAALEQELLERLARDEDFETPLGPGRWLVQLWP